MTDKVYNHPPDAPHEVVPANIERLLREVEESPAAQRPLAIKHLAMALAAEDPFTVSIVTERVKSAGKCTKQEFRGFVKYQSQQLTQAQSIETKTRTPTEDELAERWLGQSAQTAYGLGDFREYDNGIWEAVSEDTVKLSVLGILEKAKEEGVRPTARIVSSVTELIRLKIVVPDVMWDANPDYLACQNGTLYIPTRELLTHSPEYYLVSSVPYDYNPEASAYIWLTFLDDLLPDSKEFLQEFAGYALTTDTSHEIAVWLYGLPGGGKSTFLAGLQAMLGPRAGLLGLADIVRSSFALTNLPGKTLMVSAEQPAGYMKVDHILNAIISGEPIPVDRKFRDPIEITPHAKIAWGMNELPRVPANSGLFRRVYVIEFPPLPTERRDPLIKERIKHEGAGILNWALDGLARLRARAKFDIPSSVREATQQFQESNDVPTLFVAERCITGSNFKTQSQQLYKEYNWWCEDNGHKPQSSTTIAEDWKRLGFEKYRSNGRVFWKGVAIAG